MTERDATALARDAEHFRVGPSELRREGDAYVVDVDEITVPVPRRLRGRIRVIPEALTGHEESLDAAGRHVWRPHAPRARVEVDFRQPGLRWQGTGYLDSNAGSEPLEAGFRYWTWSRGDAGDEAVILYDAERRDASHLGLGLRVDRHGGVTPFEPPPRRTLPGTLWRVHRETRGEDAARLVRTFEDTPFYNRSRIASRVLGRNVEMFHEALDLDRFASRWVQTLLPFRMPRRRR
jgi:carotenoid 1,2-hydratase